MGVCAACIPFEFVAGCPGIRLRDFVRVCSFASRACCLEWSSNTYRHSQCDGTPCQSPCIRFFFIRRQWKSPSSPNALTESSSGLAVEAARHRGADVAWATVTVAGWGNAFHEYLTGLRLGDCISPAPHVLHFEFCSEGLPPHSRQTTIGDPNQTWS